MRERTPFSDRDIAWCLAYFEEHCKDYLEVGEDRRNQNFALIVQRLSLELMQKQVRESLEKMFAQSRHRIPRKELDKYMDGLKYSSVIFKFMAGKPAEEIAEQLIQQRHDELLMEVPQ